MLAKFLLRRLVNPESIILYDGYYATHLEHKVVGAICPFSLANFLPEVDLYGERATLN